MPLISIVVVTWNSGEVIQGCVSSLFEHVPQGDFELLLVDNGSSDQGYLEELESLPGIRVIRNGSNLGFSRAVNIGLCAASGEYSLVLNPDMLFVSNPFPRLVEELRRDPGIGVIGPLLHGRDGKPQIEDFYPNLPSITQYMVLRSLLAYIPAFKRLAIRFYHARLDGDPGLRFVDQIPGAFLFFRRNLFDDPAAMNEAYFIWMEDVDFCRRVHRMGLKVAVMTDEKVIHFGGTSFKMREHSWKRLMFTRSYLTYLRLHSSLPPRLLHTGLMALNSAIILMLYPFTHGRRGLAFLKARMGVELRALGMALAAMVSFRKP